MTKIFHVYRSSAGSGKTRTLAKEYLKLALRSRSDYFKHILAVTFTNKATQEMKDRIIFYLKSFAAGDNSDLAVELKAELKLDDLTFKQHANEVLSTILHTYSQFSISTIDAFFQKVIRSFTRESGLVGDYRLEIDQGAVLEEVIDNLIDELGSDEQLTRWIVDFAKENLENDRAWDVRYSLQSFAQEIFREEFKVIEGEMTLVTSAENFFENLLRNLQQTRSSFIKFVSAKGFEALNFIHDRGLSREDFKYGTGYNFFYKLTQYKRVKDFEQQGVRVTRDLQSTINWGKKGSPQCNDVIQLAESHLLPMLEDVLRYRDEYYAAALSAELVLNNFYAFGLIADISRKLTEYKNQNNLMLLADAPKFLHGVIQDSDTPFIYEKVGSFYRNYLIDEFQDTSGYQWKNFLPLLKNGLDQGFPSLIVGDVKQAIYRWRGGDLKLLQQDVEQTIGADNVSVTELDTNYRSAVHVVDFNNEVFTAAATIVGNKVAHALPVDAFKDATQKISKTHEEGFVQVTFIREEGEEKWRDLALEQVPLYLEQLQDQGILLKDIAILVRKNNEGQRIAAYLLQYKTSTHAKEGYRYDVISNESLRLDGAATVNLLLGAMKYLYNPEDYIARAQLAFEFAKLYAPTQAMTDVFVVNDPFFELNLPDAFTKDKSSLKKLPLFELTETLIQIFNLGFHKGELTYLLAFQDLVLDFFSRERNDLGAFLDWWELNKHKKSIQLSGDIDAVRIFSIHRSKGLQFKYVIMPFCSWNMDHDALKAPLLWVKSDQAPFKDAGYLPISYSSTLKETYFGPFYEQEYTRVHLDNINLLYVAFTRAEQGLLVIAPHPGNAKGYTVASLLHESITGSDVLMQNWNDALQVWKKGELKVTTDYAVNTSHNVSLSHYPVARWSDRLIIRQLAKGFFEPTQSEKFEKINYGIHMHAVLSRLQYHDDIAATLNLIAFDGLISEDEKIPLQQQLLTLMSHEQIANWFSKTWEVKTEVPILLPGGDENRIDRLMIKGKHAIMVDFKTGEPTRADRKQVQDYMRILRQMNFTEVEGYLLYLKNNEIVSVSYAGKAKVVKKKDDGSQLGLGWGDKDG